MPRIQYVVALLVVTLAPSAFAAAVSFGPSDVAGWYNDGYPRTIGFEFVVNSSVTVSRLGFIDRDQDGLSEAHGIAIWTLGGTQLATATVPSGNAADLVGMFRFASVTPLTLQAGQTYIIVGSYSGTDAWTWNPSCCSQTVDVANVVVDSRISLAGPGHARAAVGTTDLAVFPTWTSASDGRIAFYGPNMEFADVPEPATFLLLGCGLVGLSLLSRRRKS